MEEINDQISYSCHKMDISILPILVERKEKVDEIYMQYLATAK